MQKKLIAMIITVTMLFTVCPSAAMADVLTESIPEVNATGYVVMEGSNGEVLFGENYDQPCAPAGTAQVMTAILAIESGMLNEEVTVPELPDYKANNAVTVYLVKGEKYTLRSLVEVMLVSSANDAAYTIAYEVGGSVDKFVEQMNAKAKELGMTKSTFKNPTGMDAEGQVVTAKDMATLACYAMQNKEFRDMVLLQQVNWQGESYKKPLPTTNKMFGIMPETTGIKSGSSNSTPYALLASAQREDRELIGVMLGTPNDSIYQNMQKVLNYGFDNTKVVPVVQKDSLEFRLSYDGKQVRVTPERDYGVSQTLDSAATITFQRNLTDVELPIKKGSEVGKLEILVDGTAVREIPLIAQDEVRKPINWFFIATLFLSVVYIASIISRIVSNVGKAKRRKAVNKRKSAQLKAANGNQYDQLMNTVEHPTQPAKTTKKKLTGTRNQDQRR